jgi:hypothetical protein
MRKNRKISFLDATAQYVHRFTCEHVPAWAKIPMEGTVEGKTVYCAPQYASDQEWYEKTFFKGESEMATSKHCYSTNPSWPCGQKLDTPFSPAMPIKFYNVTREAFNRIHTDYRGKNEDGKHSVFNGSLRSACNLNSWGDQGGTTVLTEGIHFAIVD